MAGSGSYVAVCRRDALKLGGALAMRAGDRRLALFDVDGRVYALDGACPHAGGPLAAGSVVGRHVTCSWHCATFDLRTGRSLDSISRHDATPVPVRVRDGMVWVRIPDED